MERGDCMKMLAGMDSSSVDHVITDPPYDAKTHEGMRASNGVVQLGFDELSTMAHVREMLRVAKRWVIAFCALEQLGEYKLYAGDAWVRAGFWDRVNGMPQMSGDRPGQPGEGVAIMWAGGGRKSWNGGGASALWRCPRTNGENHPTEKPVALMDMLLRQFTDYGDTVLDPFAGSGSTGVAAIRLGRNFVGCEMLDKYHDRAIVRLGGTNEQMGIQYRPKKKAKQLKLEVTHEDGRQSGGSVPELAGGQETEVESKAQGQGPQVGAEELDPDDRVRAGARVG
jgi:site-specific DNA-methyltransferase (adenine-specific)